LANRSDQQEASKAGDEISQPGNPIKQKVKTLLKKEFTFLKIKINGMSPVKGIKQGKGLTYKMRSTLKNNKTNPLENPSSQA
jgi:hypothetical protein